MYEPVILVDVVASLFTPEACEVLLHASFCCEKWNIVTE